MTINNAQTRRGGWVPPSYASFTIQDFVGDDVSGLIVADYIEELEENRERGKGLLFVGKPGVGKTMLACIVLNAAAEAGYRTQYVTLAAYQRVLMRCMEIPRLADLLVAAGAQRNEEELQELMDEKLRRDKQMMRLRSTIDFVVIDDVGKEHGTSTRFIEDEFDYLVRTRGDGGLVTVMTSNLLPDQWAVSYSDSMRSYIHQICDVVEVKGQDARRNMGM